MMMNVIEYIAFLNDLKKDFSARPTTKNLRQFHKSGSIKNVQAVMAVHTVIEWLRYSG